MIVRNSLLIIFASIFLSACASPKMSQELEGGKMKFSEGDYKEAFHELLPIAVKGRMEAQYAVGYMYYNGLGVAQDNESGIFWMTKSADQHYEPAENALQMIRA